MNGTNAVAAEPQAEIPRALGEILAEMEHIETSLAKLGGHMEPLLEQSMPDEKATCSSMWDPSCAMARQLIEIYLRMRGVSDVINELDRRLAV